MLMGLIDRVLLSLANHCSPPALSQFFITNIADLMNTLQTRFSKVSYTGYEICHEIVIVKYYLETYFFSNVQSTITSLC